MQLTHLHTSLIKNGGFFKGTGNISQKLNGIKYNV